MSEAAINAAYRRLGIDTKSELIGHGWRSIARTLLHEKLKYPPEVIEHQLAHAVPDTLGRAYNRTKFINERKEMMQTWADYLGKLKAGAEVVKFPVRSGTWFKALEPIYQGIRTHYGPLKADIAKGLVLRHDHGPQSMSHAFQAALDFLGIEPSPSFIVHLKEQLLWVKRFYTVEALRQALLAFREGYNQHWLWQRHEPCHTSKRTGCLAIASAGGCVNFVQNSVQEFGGFTVQGIHFSDGFTRLTRRVGR